MLAFVHVPHAEALLRRLEPEVQEIYRDHKMNDQHGKLVEAPSLIRFGIDDPDAPVDEVITEIQRFSGMPPASRPASAR